MLVASSTVCRAPAWRPSHHLAAAKRVKASRSSSQIRAMNFLSGLFGGDKDKREVGIYLSLSTSPALASREHFLLRNRFVCFFSRTAIPHHSSTALLSGQERRRPSVGTHCKTGNTNGSSYRP